MGFVKIYKIDEVKKVRNHFVKSLKREEEFLTHDKKFITHHIKNHPRLEKMLEPREDYIRYLKIQVIYYDRVLGDMQKFNVKFRNDTPTEFV